MRDGAHSLETGGTATTVAELLARNGGRPVRLETSTHARAERPSPAELTVPSLYRWFGTPPRPQAMRGTLDLAAVPVEPAMPGFPFGTVPAPRPAPVPGPLRSDVPPPLAGKAKPARKTRSWKFATASAASLTLAGAMLIGGWALGLGKGPVQMSLADGQASAQEPPSGQLQTGQPQTAQPPAGQPAADSGPQVQTQAPLPDQGQFTGTLPVAMTNPPSRAERSTGPQTTSSAPLTRSPTAPPTTRNAPGSATPPPAGRSFSPNPPRYQPAPPGYGHDNGHTTRGNGQNRDNGHPKGHDGGGRHHR